MAESVSDEKGRKIRELVAQMKLYNNPQELEDLKKLIRKNVPLTMRGYFSAYLYVLSGNSAKPAASHTEKSGRPEMPQNAVSLYVNVGKASRGPAKDLVAFICENSGLTEQEIYSVSYKQNYSFVYISKAKADCVIEKVNGKTFKGRKVKVNFSKEKDAE